MPFDVVIGRNESDKKDFGSRGLAYIGKSYVKMGQHTSLSLPTPHAACLAGTALEPGSVLAKTFPVV